MPDLDTTIRKSIFDRAPGRLKINSRFIEMATVRLHQEDISEFCFGYQPIRGVYFNVGVQFEFKIRDIRQKTIRISFRYYYRIRRKELQQLYREILNTLWEFYFGPLTVKYLESFQAGKIIRIGDVGLTAKGVHFEDKSLIIPWEELGTKTYWNNLTLYSKSIPDVSRSFYFRTDWNTLVLATLIQEIPKLRDPLLHS